MSKRGTGRSVVGGGKVRSLPTRILSTFITTSTSTPEASESLPGTPSSSSVALSHSPSTPGTDISTTDITSKSWPKDADKKYILIIDGNQFVGGKPDAGHWFRAILRNRVPRDFWPTLDTVPDDIKVEWWIDFTSNYSIEEGTTPEKMRAAFNALVKKNYRQYIYDTKNCWKTKGVLPQNWEPSVSAAAKSYWESDKVVEESDRGKSNRAGTSGKAAKHTCGSINYATHHRRQEEYHRQLDIEVPVNTRSGRPHINPNIWKRVASEGRGAKGPRLYGFGDFGPSMLGLSSRRRHSVTMDNLSGSMSSSSTPEAFQAILDARLAEERQ